MINIGIIIASTRKERVGERVGRWVCEKASKRKGWKTELVDLQKWPLPFLDFPIEKTEKKAIDELSKKWSEKINSLDGFIVVTPEYNHGYNAALKNAIDYLYGEWEKKPVSFVSYGGASGGARSVEQLKQVFAEFEAVIVSEAVLIQFVRDAFNHDGSLKDDERRSKQADKMLDSLIWWAELLKKARQNAPPV